MDKTGKPIIKTEWDSKFLREFASMPFGSMSNIIAQAYQGKGITSEELKSLARTAWDLAREFTIDAYNSSVKQDFTPPGF